MPKTLFRRAVSDLTLAILAASLLTLPVLLVVEHRMTYEHHYEVLSLPLDDASLESWLRAQEGVERPSILRLDHALDVTYTLRSRILSPHSVPVPPWPDLGYGGLRSARYSAGYRFDWKQYLLLLAVAAQIGFLGVGVRRLGLARRAGEPIPPLFAGSLGPALRTGLLGGVALLAFGLLYDRVTSGLVPPEYITSPWSHIVEVGLITKLALVATGTLVAPVCEEIFFRGSVLGSYLGAGRALAGMLVSAALFALVHFDLARTPAFFVYGLAFAWLYRRTRSLAAPIVAHAVNNGVAFALILAGIE